jgi:hypothetical protein
MRATIQSIRFNVTQAGVVRAVVTALSEKKGILHSFHLNTPFYQVLNIDEGDVVKLDRDERIVSVLEQNGLVDRCPPLLPTECPCCEGELESLLMGLKHQLLCLDCKGRSAVINDIDGSMLKIAPKGSVVVIPVNTVGVTGRGMALYMRTVYKQAFARYMRQCRRGRIDVGPMDVVEDGEFEIALFPTKYGWRDASLIPLIRRSAERLRNYLDTEKITEVHMPRVGCGVGTGCLDYFGDVRPVLDEVFANSGIQVNVYDWSST